MANVRLKLKSTARLAQVSTEHPTIEFKILTSHRTEDGVISILKAELADPTSIIWHFEEASEVYSYEILYIDDQTILVQFLIPEPEARRAVFTSDNLPRYPLVLRDGWLFAEMTTSQERISQYIAELEAANIWFEIISLTQSLDPTELLTTRQQQFVSEALKQRYYANPRQCSLTDLARLFDVSQPTASGVLHRAEGRIVENFYAGIDI